MGAPRAAPPRLPISRATSTLCLAARNVAVRQCRQALSVFPLLDSRLSPRTEFPAIALPALIGYGYACDKQTMCTEVRRRLHTAAAAWIHTHAITCTCAAPRRRAKTPHAAPIRAPAPKGRCDAKCGPKVSPRPFSFLGSRLRVLLTLQVMIVHAACGADVWNSHQLRGLPKQRTCAILLISEAAELPCRSLRCQLRCG